MDYQNIIDQLNPIFRRILDNENISLTASTTANDVEGWDSLNHLQLVVAIERHFKIKFTASEIQNWENVGEICESVLKRTSQ